MYSMWINGNLEHQVGDQTKVNVTIVWIPISLSRPAAQFPDWQRFKYWKYV